MFLNIVIFQYVGWVGGKKMFCRPASLQFLTLIHRFRFYLSIWALCSECPVYAGCWQLSSRYIEGGISWRVHQALKAKYIIETSLRFYFVSNVNNLKSVFSQKIFDPTLIVLINIKQLNKTVWHIIITTFEQL